MKILMTGGSGLLGTELRKYIKCDAPSHRDLDITKQVFPKDYDLIIHCAAYTDLVQAEVDKRECFRVNFEGTRKLVNAYPHTPFIFISTEYVYRGWNFYTLTKLEAEKYIRSCHSSYLIIRTLFKPRPFPHDMAFTDQYTLGDYVDVIAPLIVSAMARWHGQPSTIDIGTERKTMYELALRTRSDVKKGLTTNIENVRLPKDYLI